MKKSEVETVVEKAVSAAVSKALGDETSKRKTISWRKPKR